MKLPSLILIILFSTNVGGGYCFLGSESVRRQNLPASLYEETSKELAKFSKQAGLINLRSLNLPATATEIRIWKGGGLLYPRCFVLKTREQSRQAYLVAPKVVHYRAVYNSRDQVIYERTNLGNPRSGWKSIDEYLSRTGIHSQMGLALDQTNEPDPDEEMLVLEFLRGRRYELVFYLDSTKSQDGRKAVQLRRTLENEFGKKLGCGK